MGGTGVLPRTPASSRSYDVRYSATTARLQKVDAAYRAAAYRAEQLRAERNEAVREALAQGMTHQQVGDATGLSRGRISQLVASR